MGPASLSNANRDGTCPPGLEGGAQPVRRPVQPSEPFPDSAISRGGKPQGLWAKAQIGERDSKPVL